MPPMAPFSAGYMQINPFIAVMNSMNYTAMTLGNHEFNFGSKVFVDTFSQASFPILGANVTDSGAYGINKVEGVSTNGAKVNVRDSISVSLPTGTADPLNVAILGHHQPSRAQLRTPQQYPRSDLQ